MKVLVLTAMYPTERDPWSGCFVRDQVEDLRELGVETRVFYFAGRADWRQYMVAARVLRDLLRREPADLVHAHYGLAGATGMVQRLAPVVTTFHGSDTVIPWQRSVSWVVARATTPVFVSAEGARRLGKAAAPIVPAAVDTRRFAPLDRADARRALGWDEHARYVLLPGARDNPVKGAQLFDAVVERVRQRAAGVDAVSLEGWSRDEAALVLNAADVTLMTSRSEGAPVTIKESLACATPVVSVPVGDVPSLVGDLPGCAIAPRDPVALADAVLQALQAPRDLALRERAENFSRGRIARRIADLYSEVLA
jgi:glycosyltransferase involved in cell wall biosynthesis